MANNVLNWTDTNSTTATTSNETEIRIYKHSLFFDTSSLPAIHATLAADTITYTDTGLADGAKNYYMVSAFNNGVEKFTGCRMIITTSYVGIETTITVASIDYKLIKFYEEGIFTLPVDKTLDYLVVGCGGSSGSASISTIRGFGGGGGGQIISGSTAYEAGSYGIDIDLARPSYIQGHNGKSVTFNIHTALGGGGGGGGSGGAENARAGGYNGGGGGFASTAVGSGATDGAGFDGADATSTHGGGGAGAGADASSFNGGIGVQSDITGSNEYYGGGGAGKDGPGNITGARGSGTIGGGGGPHLLAGATGPYLGEYGIVILRYPVL